AVSSPQGRFAVGASTVDGRVLLRAEAIGKHLLHHYDVEHIVHVHLGLYGTFTEQPLPAGEPRGQVRMRLVGERTLTDLRGPAACELLTGDQVAALRARLGPDPLRREAEPDRAFARIVASRSAVATQLLDQRVLAGVGNVYRAEVLFRHGVDPMTPGNCLDHALWQQIWADLVALMREGARRGRIDTVRAEDTPEATGRAARRDRHGGEVYVYRRAGEPCLRCGTAIRTAELAGRNLYWCPSCQR
ncbi:MAG: Fpg/Nei family DNA glycosylase, partial [Sciscionella sp.]